MNADLIESLDDLVLRLRVATQRPAWRRRLLSGSEHGLAIGDLRVLRAVERRRRSDKDVSIGDVAEDVGVEHSTASRAVAAVVGKRLLTKSPSSTDQRCSSLELTRSGKDTLEEATRQRRTMVAEAMSDWGTDDLAHLVGLLERLTVAFEADR